MSTIISGPRVILDAAAMTDSPGTIALDARVDTTFLILLEQDNLLQNPVGMVTGDVYKMLITQGQGAPWELTFDTAYAFEDGKIPKLSRTAGAVDLLRMVATSPPPGTTDAVQVLVDITHNYLPTPKAPPWLVSDGALDKVARMQANSADAGFGEPAAGLAALAAKLPSLVTDGLAITGGNTPLSATLQALSERLAALSQ